MDKYLSYEKFSKKKQQEIDRRKRGSWGGVKPVTRRIENSKAYNRKKAQNRKIDSGFALF